MQLITNTLVALMMPLVDYFIMGEAVGIVATLFVSFYYSRRQMKKLPIDIETKIHDMDEKYMDLHEWMLKGRNFGVTVNVHRIDQVYTLFPFLPELITKRSYEYIHRTFLF